MKKRMFLVITVLLIISSFTVVVSSHSGGTDSNGGHYNHSTGEYHYHHGYSEHQHYDMDGDGDIDCPYSFVSNSSVPISSSSVSSSDGWISDDELDEMLNVAFMEGQTEGYNSGYESGYENGSEDGYEDASYALAREYEEKLEAELKHQKETHYLIFGLILAPLIVLITIAICNSNSRSQIKDLQNIGSTELVKYKTENAKLKKALNDHTEATYVLNLVATKAGASSAELARSLFVNFRKAQGLSEDAARSEFEKEMQQFKKHINKH